MEVCRRLRSESTFEVYLDFIARAPSMPGFEEGALYAAVLELEDVEKLEKLSAEPIRIQSDEDRLISG